MPKTKRAFYRYWDGSHFVLQRLCQSHVKNLRKHVKVDHMLDVLGRSCELCFQECEHSSIGDSCSKCGGKL